jgi:hypothetical protein
MICDTCGGPGALPRLIGSTAPSLCVTCDGSAREVRR